VGAESGWDFESPQALAADVLYHALDPAESLFSRLEQMDLIALPPGWDKAAEGRYLSEPPEDSRAWLRGKCIARFGGAIRNIDWGEIGFRKLRLTLPDPLRAGRECAEQLLDCAKDVETFLSSVGPRFDGIEQVSPVD
jgi:proteasome accessory factor A